MVLKGLYYLHSVALILINSSLMLEAPYTDRRELGRLELYRAPRAPSKELSHKINHVVVKNGMVEMGKRPKVLKMQVIYYLLDPFQLGSAMVHALRAEVLL